MPVNSFALLVIAMVLLALFALIGFAIHRLANVNAKVIVATIAAMAVLLGAVPAVILAFQAFVS